MNIINKIFNYSEDYKYKVWKIFGIRFSIVKKYKAKKVNIYEEIDEKYKRFKEIEIELEERILTIHKENKEIYDYALSLGKKIIIVSDMYLPKEVIEKIFIKNNYANYYKLYLSSDLMLTKASGNLYKYIINDLNVKPSTIMHLGDNYHSDFENPRLYGIDAFFIEKIIDIFLKKNIRAEKLLHENENNIGVSIMLGLSAFSCFNKNDKNKENNYWRNFGFIYGGPAVFSYMNWLKKQIIKENIKEVLFVARDGYSLKKVFDIIKPEYIKTHYIYAPRIIYYLITLDFSMHFKYYPIESFEVIKSVLEYYKDKDEYLQKNTPNINSDIQGYEFILDNIEIYKNLTKQEYQNYKEYINSININSDKIATVDTFSIFLSSQKLMSLFLGKENVIGYYWFFIKNTYLNNKDYNINSFQKDYEHKFCDWDIMEFLITSAEPTIKNIIDSKPLYYTPNKYEQKRIKIYKYISEGIIDFAKNASDIFFDLESFITDEEITKWINILYDIYTETDKKYLREIKHAWNIDHSKYVPILKKWFIQWSGGKKYYLFSLIPIIKQRLYFNVKDYYLFDFIPILRIKENENNIKTYLLFMFFPVLKIKE